MIIIGLFVAEPERDIRRGIDTHLHILESGEGGVGGDEGGEDVWQHRHSQATPDTQTPPIGSKQTNKNKNKDVKIIFATTLNSVSKNLSFK